MVEISQSPPEQGPARAASTPGVSSKKEMGGKKAADGENGVSVMIMPEEEDVRTKRGGRGGDGGGGGGINGRSEDRDSMSTRSGAVCCSEGRIWIFLVLGVLTLVFSAVLIGIYMNMRTLTSSMHLVEVMPSYIPAAVGGVAALSVLVLFWRRSKLLMYLVLFLCASATILCVATAVLTGTRILQPILNAQKCHYIPSSRTCRCEVNDGDSSTSVSTSYLVMKDTVGCSVVKDILPNMLFTLVGIYGVIALVCTINGLISLLVCRMELNRKRMQSADYGTNYSSSPTSSSESFMEQQTMLPSQQPLQQPQSANTPNASSVTVTATTSTVTISQPDGKTFGNIYTNANAIDDVTTNDETNEITPSDLTYSPSDPPIGYTEACQMKRSKSFSQPRRSTIREGSPQSSSSTASHAPSSVLGGASDEERKLIPKRKKNRRAVTLHGLDRDQLMLILSLQMRYLQETEQDSKKPDDYALENVTTSANDISASGTSPDSPSSSDSNDGPTPIKPVEPKKASSMKEVLAGNLNGANHCNQAFVGSDQLVSTQQTMPGNQLEWTGSTGAFTQMQRRAMTPTPRQERLSSCRTTDDEMENHPPPLVRSHTPQPHHFRSEHQIQHQQQVLQEQQRQQYLLKLQQEYQFWSLEQQLQQQRQIQELQYQNMKQKQELLLHQQQKQVQMQQKQQLYNGLPPQQHPLNQQYHQIIQQQLRQAPFSSSHSGTLSTSTIDNGSFQVVENNEVDDDNEPATHITIDLRDITKTGPVIYENVPPAKTVNLMSHSPSNTNSVSSVPSTTSTLRDMSVSPQPKSILVNKGTILPNGPPQTSLPCQPPELEAAMMLQMSNSSNQSLLSSSGTGSVSSEIQRAFTAGEQPLASVGENVQISEATEGDKNDDKDSGKVKWTKKLSMKLKRDKKERDKDKGKSQGDVEEGKGESENDLKIQTSGGLVRSDSDVRRSGVFPDRWQAIMMDSAVQQGPQTLWENVQRKIIAEPEANLASSTNPPPYPGKPQVPARPTYANVNRSAPRVINSNQSEGHYSNLPNSPQRSNMPPETSVYSNTASHHPGLPNGNNSAFQAQQAQPPANPAEGNVVPQSIMSSQQISDHTFLPIASNQSPFSDDYAIEGRSSSKPNLRRSNSLVDPNAPPKPPRLQQLTPSNGEMSTDVHGQPLRPKSYVRAISKDGTLSNNNSLMSGEDCGSGGLNPRPGVMRMQMEGPVRADFGGDNRVDRDNVIGEAIYSMSPKYGGNQMPPAHQYGSLNPNQIDDRVHPLSPRQQPKPAMRMPVREVIGEPSRSHSSQNPLTNEKMPSHHFNPTYASAGHAICDTDLDDLPVFRPGRGRYQVQSSFPPPPYAPPPIYRSMESVARQESVRSTSSSSSEPHNTSCTLSEPHNTSYTLSEPHNTSSDQSFTPPMRSDPQRSRNQVPGGALSQGPSRGRSLQPRGRNMPTGDRHRSAGSRFAYRSPTLTYDQDLNAVPLGTTPPSPQAQVVSEPYMLMRRCQSVEDKGRSKSGNNFNGSAAYGSSHWSKGFTVNPNSSLSSSSSNGDSSDVIRFPPNAVDIRRQGQKSSAFADHSQGKLNMQKNIGQNTASQELRQLPQGSCVPTNVTNSSPALNGSRGYRRFLGNSSLLSTGGNFRNGLDAPPHKPLDNGEQTRLGTTMPYDFASDDFGFAGEKAEAIGISWDAVDDDIVNRPLRKLTLSGSEEIVGYMAGMDGVSPDGDEGGYAESVI